MGLPLAAALTHFKVHAKRVNAETKDVFVIRFPRGMASALVR
jgi:hypothetical protein